MPRRPGRCLQKRSTDTGMRRCVQKCQRRFWRCRRKIRWSGCQMSSRRRWDSRVASRRSGRRRAQRRDLCCYMFSKLSAVGRKKIIIRFLLEGGGFLISFKLDMYWGRWSSRKASNTSKRAWPKNEVLVGAEKDILISSSLIYEVYECRIGQGEEGKRGRHGD